MYQNIDLALNKTYWKYEGNASYHYMRPSPYKGVEAIKPKYQRCGVSFRKDMTDLVRIFKNRYQNSNFIIALSGGIDSELVAETFYKLDIPFKAVTLRLFNGSNDYDIYHAYEYCKKRSIDLQIVNLSLDKFITKVLPPAIEFGQFTHSLSQAALTYLFSKMGSEDILIFSGHNPDFRDGTAGWLEDSPNLVKYAKNTYRNFFTFTSLEPIFIHYVKSYDPSELGNKNSKFIYEAYPELIERTKLTGWEDSLDIQKNYNHLLDQSVGEEIFITWK